MGKQAIMEAAARAALEAAKRERERCTWILQRLLQRAEASVQNKLLSASEMQLVRVRLEITRTVVKAATGLIMAGVRPPQPQPKGVVRVQEESGGAESGAAGDGQCAASSPQADAHLQEAPELKPGRFTRLVEGDQGPAEQGPSQEGGLVL